MRIQYECKGFFPRSYYEFEGIREEIRFDGGYFCWNFNGTTYRTCASNYPKVYRNDLIVASCLHRYGSKLTLWNPQYVWKFVDVDGHTRRIVSTGYSCKFEWRMIDGYRIMTFFRQGWSHGTAVIRPDWSENVGILVGLFVPLVLSTG